PASAWIDSRRFLLPLERSSRFRHVLKICRHESVPPSCYATNVHTVPIAWVHCERSHAARLRVRSPANQQGAAYRTRTGDKPSSNQFYFERGVSMSRVLRLAIVLSLLLSLLPVLPRQAAAAESSDITNLIADLQFWAVIVDGIAGLGVMDEKIP